MKKTLTTMLALTLSISLLMVTESEAIAQKKGRSFGKSVQGRTAARSMQRRAVQQSLATVTVSKTTRSISLVVHRGKRRRPYLIIFQKMRCYSSMSRM